MLKDVQNRAKEMLELLQQDARRTWPHGLETPMLCKLGKVTIRPGWQNKGIPRQKEGFYKSRVLWTLNRRLVRLQRFGVQDFSHPPHDAQWILRMHPEEHNPGRHAQPYECEYYGRHAWGSRLQIALVVIGSNSVRTEPPRHEKTLKNCTRTVIVQTLG